MSKTRDTETLELLAKAHKEYAEYVKIADVIRLVADDSNPPIRYFSSAGLVINQARAGDAQLG